MIGALAGARRSAGRRGAAAALAALSAAAAATGCGTYTAPGPPAACTASTDAIVRALRHAPQRVTLGGGTRISTCIERSTGTADLQNAGGVLSEAASRLASAIGRRAGAAPALGYLVGAVQRGAGRTNGVHSELANRLSTVIEGTPRVTPAQRAAYDRGLRAGRAAG